MHKESKKLLLEATNKLILLIREMNHQVPKEITKDILWYYFCQLQSIEFLLTETMKALMCEDAKEFLEKEVV